MQSIVDGLEIEFHEAVAFEQINASTNEGLRIFNSYGLFGHPSYLILNDVGDILWQSVGEQTEEFIKSGLISALEN